MAKTPWGGDPPLDSTYWMDWFNYYLGLGYRWEDAAKLSWMEIEHRSDSQGRLAIGLGTLGEEQLTPGLDYDHSFRASDCPLDRAKRPVAKAEGDRRPPGYPRGPAAGSVWAGGKSSSGDGSTCSFTLILMCRKRSKRRSRIPCGKLGCFRQSRPWSPPLWRRASGGPRASGRSSNPYSGASLGRKIRANIFDLRLASVFECEPVAANASPEPLSVGKSRLMRKGRGRMTGRCSRLKKSVVVEDRPDLLRREQRAIVRKFVSHLAGRSANRSASWAGKGRRRSK